MTVHPLAKPTTGVPGDELAANLLALRVLNDSASTEDILARLRQELAALDPWQAPPAGAGLLLAALAATVPDALSSDIGEALAHVVNRCDLTQCRQPGLDLAMQLLPLVISTPAGVRLPSLAAKILGTPDVHPRWARRAAGILIEILDWRAELLDLEHVLEVTERAPAAERTLLFHRLVVPLILADPSTIDTKQFARVRAIPSDEVEARYLAGALASHSNTSLPVREAASALAVRCFPLRAAWHRVLGNRGLRVLCVQNIVDGQGDEIVRTVPLLQALLDGHPDTHVVLLTDRAYLYGHPRIDTISFDERERIKEMLATQVDCLIEFTEPDVRHLNHDPDLADRLEALRRDAGPSLDIQASKRWNQFGFDSVRFGGLDWARPLGLDRPRYASVYEPAFRLIMELGLPLRIGRHAPISGPVLAGRCWAAADEAWRATTKGNRDQRPVALVNPFGGSGPLKGFVPRKYGDLTALISALVAEGYFVVLCPNGRPWGSARAASEVRDRLPTSQQHQVVIAPDPFSQRERAPLEDDELVTAPYTGVVMHRLMSFIARAELVVTVEGWMVHAAYLLGRPYRVLMLPESQHEGWQPWGESRYQRHWLFAGDPVLDRPPLPEQPRKRVWLALLDRVTSPIWQDHLAGMSRSEDAEIRAAVARALGRSRGHNALPYLRRLLEDSSHQVRGAAAWALMTGCRAEIGRDGLPSVEELEAYRLIGTSVPDWESIAKLGNKAGSALRAALRGDDPVMRREAAILIEGLSRSHQLAPEAAPGDKDMASPATPTEDPVALRASTAAAGTRAAIARLAAWARARPHAKENHLTTPKVLILTPVKDAVDSLPTYHRLLRSLTYPHRHLSLGLLESDSRDGTFEALRQVLPSWRREFARVGLWKHDFGYQLPPELHRGDPLIQQERRRVLALSRNQLLSRALADEDWVLWLDVDIIAYPPDIIERLLETGKNIVQPHCVLDYGGPTFDQNGWRDRGRIHLDDVRDEGDLVPLDTVGGTMLLIRADLHRNGLIFPPIPYRPGHPKARRGEGELETEGLGILAADMGEICWGMPRLEILHRRA